MKCYLQVYFLPKSPLGSSHTFLSLLVFILEQEGKIRLRTDCNASAFDGCSFKQFCRVEALRFQVRASAVVVRSTLRPCALKCCEAKADTKYFDSVCSVLEFVLWTGMKKFPFSPDGKSCSGFHSFDFTVFGSPFVQDHSFCAHNVGIKPTHFFPGPLHMLCRLPMAIGNNHP